MLVSLLCEDDPIGQREQRHCDAGSYSRRLAVAPLPEFLRARSRFLPPLLRTTPFTLV